MRLKRAELRAIRSSAMRVLVLISEVEDREVTLQHINGSWYHLTGIGEVALTNPDNELSLDPCGLLPGTRIELVDAQEGRHGIFTLAA